MKIQSDCRSVADEIADCRLIGKTALNVLGMASAMPNWRHLTVYVIKAPC